jgi:hypothetical protein
MTPCKPVDFERHLAIARLMRLGASCRSAVTMTVNKIGGTEQVRAANHDRLYRNHLKNHAAYEELVRTKDHLANLWDRLQRAERAVVYKDIDSTLRMLTITLDDGTPLTGDVHFHRKIPEGLTEIRGTLSPRPY